MKIYTEKSLRDFDFWNGAKDTVKYLTPGELDQLEYMLEECYPEGADETEINNFFWFEEDTIAKWLGYESFKQIMQETMEG